MLKVIVAGSRDFKDSKEIFCRLNYLFQHYKPEDIEIVSGTARGVDQIGEQFAKKRGMKIKRFPADWAKYGKSAGPIRNEQMAKYATHCVCFHRGKSLGTANMIQLAEQYKLETRVYRYESR